MKFDLRSEDYFFSVIIKNDDEISPFINGYRKSMIDEIFDKGNVDDIRLFLEGLFDTFSFDASIFSGKEALLRDTCYTFLMGRGVFCSREDPSLLGGSCLMIEPSPLRRVLLEFKLHREGGPSPRRLLRQAIGQILDRKYGVPVPPALLDRYAVVVIPSGGNSRPDILVERVREP